GPRRRLDAQGAVGKPQETGEFGTLTSFTCIVAGGYHRCMAMKQELAVDDHATQAYAHLFQAFADPTRRTLLQHLSTGEHRVRDLVEHMHLAQSTVSNHLSFLLECWLITPRPQGTATSSTLTEPSP